MMKLHIIALGTLKESYWQEAYAEYTKRLKLYAKIRLTEIKEESFRSDNERAEVQKKEAEKILARITPGSRVFVFDERGTSYTSVDFARLLESASAQGDEITFILGGPLGLDASVRARAERVIAFGALTVPHQLARILLVEQVYRAGTILAQKPYHY